MTKCQIQGITWLPLTQLTVRYFRLFGHLDSILKQSLTLVLLRGVVPTPLTVIALVLKIAQPRGKIAPGTFKFILSLHFSEKISNLPPTPGVG